MKKSIFKWQIAGFVFTCVFGVILHFLFDWTGQSIFVAPFSAVNESIWEHTKLLFFPMLVFAIFEYIYVGEYYDNFWCIKLRGMLLSILLIPTLYYTINGVLGGTPDWVNIAIFFIVASWVYIKETKYFKKNNISCRFSAFYALVFVALLFALFTFLPPHIPLFQDPISQTYGFFNAVRVGISLVDIGTVKVYNKLTS